MVRKELRDRTLTIYLGKSEGDDRITKDEVGDHIVGEMGLTKNSGEPAWSKGIAELIEEGIDSWGEQIANPDLLSDLEEAEERIEELEDENERLRAGNVQSGIEVNDPEREAFKSECRVLEVLCRDEHLGKVDPNFVGYDTIKNISGLKYKAILQALDGIQDFHPGYIKRSSTQEQVKAASPNAFEKLCEDYGFDPDEIRGMN